MDNSRIESPDDEAQVISILRTILPAAEINGVELHLETSLGPRAFAGLLERCPHPLVRANYDSGNSASLGYRVSEEFAAYGHRIGSVHIKDRRFGGGTVPLGTGDADLPDLFRGLAALNYSGDYVLQIARSEPGQELPWITQNLSWVAGQIEAVKRPYPVKILMIGLGGIGQRHTRNLRALLGNGVEIIAYRVRRQMHVVTPTMGADTDRNVEKST